MRLNLRRLKLAACTLLVAAAGSVSFAAAPPPEPTPRLLITSVEVSVTSIDVVVTDAKGNRVRDLRREDFEVREDGKVQPLSNFLFVDDTAPAPPEEVPSPGEAPTRPQPGVLTPGVSKPQARIAAFIDNLHLPPWNRNAVLGALDGFLRKAVGPNVEAMVVSYDRALRVRGAFTRDAEVLSRVLNQISDESTPGAGRLSERNRLFKQIDEAAAADARSRELLFASATSAVQSFAERERYDVESTLKAVKLTISRLAGIDGRKILILVSEKLPQSPAAEVWEYLRNARRAAGLPDNDPNIPLLAGSESDQMHNFQELASAANAALVSLNTFDAAGLGFDSTLNAERAGSFAPVGMGRATVQQDAMLQLLADETGGVSALQRNDFSAVLSEMEQDWKIYYSLGYPTPPKKEGKPRKIAVAVKVPGLKARARNAVLERKADERLAEQVTSGLFFPSFQNPLEARVLRGRLLKTKDPKVFVLQLEIRVPYAKLTLVPERGKLRGGVLFSAAAKSADGRQTPVKSQRLAVEVSEADVASGKASEFIWTTTFEVRLGLQTFSLALTDEISRVTTLVQPEFSVGPREESASR